MATFALEGPKWASNTITWSFASPGPGFSNAITGAYQAVIEQALQRWQQVVNVTFQQVADGAPGTDIRIGWSTFASPQIGETDYTYSTTAGTQTFLPGMSVRIEDPATDPVAATTTSLYQGTSTSLFQIALHEIGHALGLGLDSDPSAVMFLTLGPSDRDLSASDIAGVQSLYGPPAAPPTPVVAPRAVSLPPPVTLSGDDVAVYRFFDAGSGAQFLTADVNERNTVIQTRPDMVYEGLGLAGVGAAANDPNAIPVYRFFDSHTGTHFFTASAAEKQSIVASRPDLVLEQNTFEEHATQQSGDVAVYRFFDRTDGTHFFTTSDTERATIAATRSDMNYEGIAFYAPAS